MYELEVPKSRRSQIRHRQFITATATVGTAIILRDESLWLIPAFSAAFALMLTIIVAATFEVTETHWIHSVSVQATIALVIPQALYIAIVDTNWLKPGLAAMVAFILFDLAVAGITWCWRNLEPDPEI